MRGLSTSASSCPRRCRFLRPLPESQFFCGPESPEFPRVPAVRRSSAESHGLVTEPVPCSLHASLTDERLRARSPASDGDDHDPDEGTAMGREATARRGGPSRDEAGWTRVDQSLIPPASVPPSHPPGPTGWAASGSSLRVAGSVRHWCRPYPANRRLEQGLARTIRTQGDPPRPEAVRPRITTIRIAPPTTASDPPRPARVVPATPRVRPGVSC